jgi:hypothetical protein
MLERIAHKRMSMKQAIAEGLEQRRVEPSGSRGKYRVMDFSQWPEKSL